MHFISKIQTLDQISVNILHYGPQIFSVVRKEIFIAKSMFLYCTSVQLLVNLSKIWQSKLLIHVVFNL